MTPDYERAATKALETILKYGINSAPIFSIVVLRQIPNVLTVSYEEISNAVDQDRECIMSMFGEKNMDASTTVILKDGKPNYIIAYNQRLPLFLAQRMLARELGHIILGHDGSLPEDIRNEEAKAFAHHFLCPRPLIHSIQALGFRFTMEILGNLTGCNDYCISCMRKIPGAHVPAELNAAVRTQFMPYIANFFEYQRSAMHKDGSQTADFGTYMDNYVE